MNFMKNKKEDSTNSFFTSASDCMRFFILDYTMLDSERLFQRWTARDKNDRLPAAELN